MNRKEALKEFHSEYPSCTKCRLIFTPAAIHEGKCPVCRDKEFNRPDYGYLLALGAIGSLLVILGMVCLL